MTNNDEMALKLNWLARKAKFGHFDLQEFLTEANPANILALLAERDADKKRIAEQQDIIAKQEKWIKDVELTMIAANDRAEDAEKRIAAMSQTFMNLKLLADVYLHAYEEAKASVAELEARTVSVKLLDCDFAAVQHMSGGSTDYCNGFVDGTQNAVKCFKADLAAAGINLEVGE
ncbi:ead/Ea22-like family protein [Salmonella enterica]|uniref:ead/Ea22-like family protein n=1 Tax=Salmonella enterica TaxID=28901 RepID=UPI0002B60906|nr:ead/Ea22-like family protein [Salmonella enterica]CCS30233.1 Hypothetical protein SA40A_2199 [Salmonella enterica subsp. enterica serovar Agona str. 40.E.08]